MEVSKFWKKFEFSKASIKIKNCKIFYEAQTSSCFKEIIQAPSPTLHQITFCYISLSKKLLIEIYRNIQKYTNIWFQSALRFQFLGVQKWYSTNVFSNTKQKHVSRKIPKVRKVFGVVSRVYYVQCQVS